MERKNQYVSAEKCELSAAIDIVCFNFQVSRNNEIRCVQILDDLIGANKNGYEFDITKTHLFKYIENFTSKKGEKFQKKNK